VFTSDGTFVFEWGEWGSREGEFFEPIDVAIAPNGDVYVTDHYNHRVQVFTSNGVFLHKWGYYGNDDGYFDRPYGVAIDSTGNVYVAEYGNNRVQVFTSSGAFLTKWGSQGSGDGQLRHPCGIAISPDGTVYVGDMHNHRIQEFTSSGTFLTKWGLFGTGNGQFDYPVGVTCNSAGDVYVADSNNNRIQKFEYRTCISLDIHPRSCPNPFNIQWLENIDKGKGNDNSKTKKGGVMPAAIPGSESFDVTEINVSKLRLEGVAFLRSNYEDVTRPVSSSEACACTTGGPDGFMDLTLKFSRQEIAAAIGAVEVQDVVELTLTGELLDGTPFETSDCVTIVGKREDLPSFDSGDEVVLKPAVPNPFNPVTRISYYLPKDEFVKLSIFNVTGKLIQELVAEQQSTGEHVVEWNADGMPSGVYFYRLKAGGKVLTKKMVLLK
jgi:hypothetical protein